MEVLIEFIEESKRSSEAFSPLDLQRTRVHSLMFADYYFSETGSRTDLLYILNKYLFYLNRGRGNVYSSSNRHKSPELRKFKHDAIIHTSQIKRELRTIMAGLIADSIHTSTATLISNQVHTRDYHEVKKYFKSTFYNGASIKTNYK